MEDRNTEEPSSPDSDVQRDKKQKKKHEKPMFLADVNG